MKLVLISDTHGQHRRVVLPPGEVLVHAGDLTTRGELPEVTDFLDWFGQQDFPHKILVAGNHDFFFEFKAQAQITPLLPAGITYLNDSGVTLAGIRFWGSPITPWFLDWAFNRHRGEDIRPHWELVPADTDVLITHGPVYGLLDKTARGEHVGCHDLLATVRELKPRLHVCGHIHEAYGVIKRPRTTFVNASLLNERYQLVNPPAVTTL